MKNKFAGILFCLPLWSMAQVPSSCTVPQQLADAYHKDIVQLATNYLFQIQSPDTILVQPPQAVLDEISGGLAAILNAASVPERDSVFNLYCVHDLNGWPYDYAGFLVEVDTTFAWTQAWQNLVTVTGNAYMDSLTSGYAMHIDNFYNWSFGNYAALGVDSAWNILALMDSLSYCPGVIHVEQNGILGEAGWIEYHQTGTDRYFDFYFEFNDCFDGCDNYHVWSFKVDSACSVYYLGFADWGAFGISPLPAPVNCNLFTALQVITGQEPSVFPNPAQDHVSVRVSDGVKDLPVEIAVYSLHGALQRIKIITMSEGTAVMDISELPAGIYTVVFGNRERTYRSLFVKQ